VEYLNVLNCVPPAPAAPTARARGAMSAELARGGSSVALRVVES
jgi:hypothetical protein